MSWFKKILTATNAAKAQLAIAINAIFAVLQAFNVVATQAQIASIQIAVDAVLALLVGLTFTQSSMRLKHPRPAGK